MCVFFFKQKTAYERRISDWSSDVCSSDLIAALLASMDDHLAHTPWRVVHTDPFTPEAFSARLALDGYAEQPAVIQMVLSRQLQAVPGSDITPIETEADWRALAALVRRDHEEGARKIGRAHV